VIRIIMILFLLLKCNSSEKLLEFDSKCGGWESIPCKKGYICIQDSIVLDGYGICRNKENF
jgi:hypothetical protein